MPLSDILLTSLFNKIFRSLVNSCVVIFSHDSRVKFEKIGRSFFRGEQLRNNVGWSPSWMLSKLIFLRSPRQIFEFPVHFRSKFRSKFVSENLYQLKRIAFEFWEGSLLKSRNTCSSLFLGKKRRNC